MDLITGNHKVELLTFIGSIKRTIADWQLVEVRLHEDSSKFFAIHKISDILFNQFRDKQGRIFICNDQELLMVVHTGTQTSPKQLTEEIMRSLPEHSCTIAIHKMESLGLNKIEILLEKKTSKKEDGAGPKFQKMRSLRKNNLIFIADDDMFLRSLMETALAPLGQIVTFQNGLGIADAYREQAPDIVFLDIHLPYKAGLDVLDELMGIDPDAFCIVLSADVSDDNKLQTRKRGGKGFIGKPFKKEELIECVKETPSYRP